jgi:hypothetical protein
MQQCNCWTCHFMCGSCLNNGESVSLPVYPPVVARQRLGKHVPSATNTCNSGTAGRVILCAVRVLSMESLWVCLCIPLSLLGKNSVKTFPRQRRIVGGVVFYAVHDISKESRRLVLRRTSCSRKSSFSEIFLGRHARWFHSESSHRQPVFSGDVIVKCSYGLLVVQGI